MSQMLSMMKPLPLDAPLPKEFLVEDLEYLPKTIYHILRYTLFPIKGHTPNTSLIQVMKTVVYNVVHGIRWNLHDFFLRILATTADELLWSQGICSMDYALHQVKGQYPLWSNMQKPYHLPAKCWSHSSRPLSLCRQRSHWARPQLHWSYWSNWYCCCWSQSQVSWQDLWTKSKCHNHWSNQH